MNLEKGVNMQNHLSGYTVTELQGYFSDFHKDFYGFRPRGIYTPAEWNNREILENAINAIHDTMDAMKKTAVGREQLRAAGWDVEAEESV